MMIASSTDDGTRQGAAVWRWYGAVALVLLAFYFAMPYGPSQSLLYDGFGLAAVVAILAGVRRYRPPHPLPWLLIAAGLLLMVAGDGMWTTYDYLASGDPPFPWYADIV